MSVIWCPRMRRSSFQPPGGDGTSARATMTAPAGAGEGGERFPTGAVEPLDRGEEGGVAGVAAGRTAPVGQPRVRAREGVPGGVVERVEGHDRRGHAGRRSGSARTDGARRRPRSPRRAGGGDAAAGPLLGEELVGPHPVGVAWVMVVTTSSSAPVARAQHVEAVGDLAGVAAELGVDAVLHQGAVARRSTVAAGLVGGGEGDGALGGADAAHPQGIAGRQLPGLGLGRRRRRRRPTPPPTAGEAGRRPEGRPVGGDRVEHPARGDVVVGGEGQAAGAGHLGARPAAAAQHPHLDRGALARARRGPRCRRWRGRRRRGGRGRRRPARRSRGPRPGAAGAAGLERGTGASRRRWPVGERRRDEQALRRPPVSAGRPSPRAARRPARARPAAVAPPAAGAGSPSGRGPRSMRPGWSASRRPNSSTTASGGVVAHLHGAGADPDAVGGRRHQADDERRGGAGHARVEVVLGHPVAAVAGGLGAPGQVDRVGAAPGPASTRSAPAPGRARESGRSAHALALR